MNWSKTCGGLLTGVSIGQQINWRKNHRVSEGAQLCKFIKIFDILVTIVFAELWGSFLRKGQGGVGAPLALHWVGGCTYYPHPSSTSKKEHQRVPRSIKDQQPAPRGTIEYQYGPWSTKSITEYKKLLWGAAKQSKIQQFYNPCPLLKEGLKTLLRVVFFHNKAIVWKCVNGLQQPKIAFG